MSSANDSEDSRGARKPSWFDPAKAVLRKVFGITTRSDSGVTEHVTPIENSTKLDKNTVMMLAREDGSAVNGAEEPLQLGQSELSTIFSSSVGQSEAIIEGLDVSQDTDDTLYLDNESLPSIDSEALPSAGGYPVESEEQLIGLPHISCTDTDESNEDVIPQTVFDFLELDERTSARPITDLRSLSEMKIDALKAIGITTVGALAEADVNVLHTLRSFGPASISKIRLAIFDLVGGTAFSEENEKTPRSETAKTVADKTGNRKAGKRKAERNDPFESPIRILCPLDLSDQQKRLRFGTDFGIGTTLTTRLSEAGFNSVGDIVDIDLRSLQKIRGVGRGTICRLSQSLASYGVATSLHPDIQMIGERPSPSDESDSLGEIVSNRYIGGLYNLVIPTPHPMFINTPEKLESLERELLKERIMMENNGAVHDELLCIESSWIPNDDFATLNLAFDEAVLASRQADSYEQLFCQCLADSYGGASERDFEICLRRKGIGRPGESLQEIADDLNLTRERVRQIEVRVLKHLRFSTSKRFLPFRLAVFFGAMRVGGIGSIDDLEREVLRMPLHYSGDMKELFPFCPELEVDKKEKTFRLPDYPCSNCPALIALRKRILFEQCVLSYESAIEEIGCLQCRLSYAPASSFIADIEGISSIAGMIGPKKNPTIISLGRPNTRRSTVKAIVYESDAPLSYDDIIRLFYERTGEAITKNQVASYLTSFSDCLLWDRGTYIFADRAPFPAQLIKSVCNEALRLFQERNVPILGVGGLFERFEESLQENGVPNKYALFSLMRRLDDQRLVLDDYPWVCDKSTYEGNTSFAQYFYSVLATNNGFITDAHAQMIAERCMAQSFALSGLAEYSSYVIHANGGWYDIEAADFDMEGVADLAREIASQMGDDDIVSTVKVFEDNKERCYRYGVKSHDILYYLIDMMEDDLPIEATRKPHLVKSQQKGLSALAAMRIYIKNSDRPVSREELLEEFGAKRRIKMQTVSSAVLANDEIILVGHDLFWSKDRLVIDDDFIRRFNSAIASKLRFAEKHASLFYMRSDVLPSLEELPSPGGLAWNSYLLKAVFSRSGEFGVFGSNAGCIVCLRENPDATTTEAFYHELLQNEFFGWSSFDRFAEYCRGFGIESDIRPEYFDAFSSIDADEISIQTNGLPPR